MHVWQMGRRGAGVSCWLWCGAKYEFLAILMADSGAQPPFASTRRPYSAICDAATSGDIHLENRGGWGAAVGWSHELSGSMSGIWTGSYHSYPLECVRRIV